MRHLRSSLILVLFVCVAAVPLAGSGQKARSAAKGPSSAQKTDPRIEKLKQDVVAEVQSRADLAQQMVDSIFSFGELGFQEFETSKYLVDILKKNGFQVEEGIAGIPTAFMATWGSGKPVIALGSDIDGIPQSSQKPGVAWHEPLIEGAPGHGEGVGRLQGVLRARRVLQGRGCRTVHARRQQPWRLVGRARRERARLGR